MMNAPRLRLSLLLLALSVAPAFAAGAPPPGAAGCSGCHASKNGVDSAVPRLAGRKADDIITAMTAFKTGQRPATVMDRLAKGFSDQEVRAIAEWYAEQK